MFETLVAVTLGGAISIVSQVAVDRLRQRQDHRLRDRDVRSLLQVQIFHLYSAQHLLREALESGAWWEPELNTVNLPSDDQLRLIAGTLSPENWRFYSGSLRRLRACFALRQRAQEENVQEVEPAVLQRILGAFITIDDLRHRVADRLGFPATEVPLRRLTFTEQDLESAIDQHGGIHVSRADWMQRLRGPLTTKT